MIKGVFGQERRVVSKKRTIPKGERGYWHCGLVLDDTKTISEIKQALYTVVYLIKHFLPFN